jgi:acetylornithine/N-succinyldiaminopimelate aminotransferase
LPGDVTFVPYGDPNALAAAVDDQTAAVVLEPIQGEAGVIVPPDDYLSTARAVTREHGALLWLDEIQTGMGRTGSWFNFGGTQPDVVTLAKGLGGGIPIGACLAFGEAAQLLQPGNHGSTFGGNPVATAASLAVIEVIEDEDLLANASERGHQIASAFNTEGRGLLRAVLLDRPVAAEVQKAALAAGLIVNAPTPSRLRLAPPLAMSEAGVAEGVSLLAGAIEKVMA